MTKQDYLIKKGRIPIPTPNLGTMYYFHCGLGMDNKYYITEITESTIISIERYENSSQITYHLENSMSFYMVGRETVGINTWMATGYGRLPYKEDHGSISYDDILVEWNDIKQEMGL